MVLRRICVALFTASLAGACFSDLPAPTSGSGGSSAAGGLSGGAGGSSSGGLVSGGSSGRSSGGLAGEGGSGATGGVDATGGMGAMAGAAGSGGSETSGVGGSGAAAAGSTGECAPPDCAGFDSGIFQPSIEPCCVTSQNGVESCGYDISDGNSDVLGLETGCYEHSAAGDRSAGCEDLLLLLAGGGITITLPGCCTAMGQCGGIVNLRDHAQIPNSLISGFADLGCVEAGRITGASAQATCVP